MGFFIVLLTGIVSYMVTRYSFLLEYVPDIVVDSWLDIVVDSWLDIVVDSWLDIVVDSWT